jgi:hypothetical protein
MGSSSPWGEGRSGEKEYGPWDRTQRPAESPLSLCGGASEGLRVAIPGTKPRDQPTEALLPLHRGQQWPEEVGLWGLTQRPTEVVLPPLMEGQTRAGEDGP